MTRRAARETSFQASVDECAAVIGGERDARRAICGPFGLAPVCAIGEWQLYECAAPSCFDQGRRRELWTTRAIDITIKYFEKKLFLIKFHNYFMTVFFKNKELSRTPFEFHGTPFGKHWNRYSPGNTLIVRPLTIFY